MTRSLISHLAIAVMLLGLVLLLVGTCGSTEEASGTPIALPREERNTDGASPADPAVTRKPVPEAVSIDDASRRVRRFEIEFVFSPEPEWPRPSSGEIIFYRAADSASNSRIEVARTVIQPTGFAVAELSTSGQLLIKVTGPTFEPLEEVLEPSADEVESHRLFLSPIPAEVVIFTGYALDPGEYQYCIQGQPFVGVNAPKIGPFKQFHAPLPRESAVSFSLFPFVKYSLGLYSSAGYFLGVSEDLGSFSIGERREVLFPAEDILVNTLEVEVHCVAGSEPHSSGKIAFHDTAGVRVGGDLQVSLGAGRGSTSIQVPISGKLLALYHDGYCSPVSFTLIAGDEIAITNIIGGIVKIRDRSIVLEPMPSQTLELDVSVGGLPNFESRIVQGFWSGAPTGLVHSVVREDGKVLVCGIGPDSRTLSWDGRSFSIELLRRNDVPLNLGLKLIRCEFAILTDLPAQGVDLFLRPIGRTDEFHCRAFSPLPQGEKSFLLKGEVPIAECEWRACDAVTGGPLGAGNIVIAEGVKRITLRQSK